MKRKDKSNHDAPSESSRAWPPNVLNAKLDQSPIFPGRPHLSGLTKRSCRVTGQSNVALPEKDGGMVTAIMRSDSWG